MTYTKWKEINSEARAQIVAKLQNKGLSKREIVEYFQYDNMKEAEPSFCPLYETNSKCHTLKNLNCYFCGCPYFKCSDTPLSTTEDGRLIMSICTIGSYYAKTFTIDNKSHCDCSNCPIPHSNHTVLKLLEKHSL